MTFPLSQISAEIRRLGNAMDYSIIKEAQRLYAPYHEIAPFEGLRVARDARYGGHERNRLDIVVSEETSGSARDVLIHLHGGGLVAGDKSIPGSPYNDNVPVFAARRGLVGVNMTYRLAPEAKWPAGAEDVAAAVAWAKANIAAHGGDPNRLFLMGTSAGAMHVASYVAGQGGGAPERDIKGAILLSPLYDVATAQRDDKLVAYYGEDVSRYAARSPLSALIETRIPLFAVLSELDPPDWERQGFQFLRAYFERHGKWPNFLRLLGHNHFTATMHLNTPDTYLADQIVDFIGRNA